MVGSLSEHQLLVFWVQLVVLLGTARGLGFVARRFGQPAVIGELTAGVLLGPSVFGRLAPDQAAWLFPDDAVTGGMIAAVAWLGVVLLLTTTGFEVDLPLLRRLLRRSAPIPLGGLVLPVVLGYGLGLALPDTFLAAGASRSLFAGFVAVTLAISSLPMVARILLDMGLLRRDVGQITLVAAMADDLVGWLLLGMLTGVATHGAVDAAGVGLAALGVVAFVVAALTVGQRLVDAALRASLRLTEGIAGAFSVTILVALFAAALTQWIGTEAILGAFVAGIVLGRSPLRRSEVRQGVELLSTAVFAPVFFATAGMLLDVGVLADATVVGWVLAVVAVASLSKLGGSYLGARIGRLDTRTGLAIGVGLNARGALGIVTATVALGVGVFNEVAYTTIVLVAVVTSVAVPGSLRWALARAPVTEQEARRLRHEALFGHSVTVNAQRVLLPSRGGLNSRVAARLTDLVMAPPAAVTVMSVDQDRGSAEDVVTAVAELLGSRRVERLAEVGTDAAGAILGEVRRGYDLLVLGASHHVQGPQHLSDVLQRLLVESPVPVLLVRSDAPSDEGLSFRRLLTAATGTRIGRAAEEIAYLLAARAGADVDVLHVVSRADQVLVGTWGNSVQTHPVARSLLGRSLDLARRFGMAASGLTRIGANPYEEFLAAASERHSDTLIVATRVRDVDGRPFLGHGTEYLLQHARQALVVVAFPPDLPDPPWADEPVGARAAEPVGEGGR